MAGGWTLCDRLLTGTIDNSGFLTLFMVLLSMITDQVLIGMIYNSVRLPGATGSRRREETDSREEVGEEVEGRGRGRGVMEVMTHFQLNVTFERQVLRKLIMDTF